MTLHPNTQQVLRVALALKELRGQCILVGGCAIGLLVESPSSPPARVTYDVDFIVPILTRTEFYDVESRLRILGFRQSTESSVTICRWELNGDVVDILPTGREVFGFTSAWATDAVVSATSIELGGGVNIKIAAPGVMLAMKLEAFLARGSHDPMSSSDLEDIMTLIEGR